MRKLTDFIFYKNTPLTNFTNTIHFESNEKRDAFFLGHPYPSIFFSDKFNFIRDRGQIDVNVDYESFAGVNYCTFLSDFEDERYYAYVISYEYVNDNVTRVNLLIDGLMTYCQGTVIDNFKNLTVTRKHMKRTEYNRRINELKNNDDVIKTFTKHYTHNEKLLFDELSCLIETSVSLTQEFGTVNNPQMSTSVGSTFDNFTAPTNLYVVEKEHFTDFMEILSYYPWIAQNIRKISLMPSSMITSKTKVEMVDEEFNHLYRLTDNGKSSLTDIDVQLLDLSKTLEMLYEIFDLDDKEDKHLLRNEYTTTELYNYNGGELLVDNGLLSEKYGLFFRAMKMAGYHNELAVYVHNYNSVEDEEGTFLNNALFIRDFDDVPILIDNYTLALSKSAHQREVTEGRLITNRLSNIATGDDLESRFYDAASLVTNFSPLNFFGKFVSEHEYYENQMAEFKDLKLQTPTVTGQTSGNALSIAGDYFGLHLKFSQPTKDEWEKVKKYYKMYGYSVNDENSTVSVNTMTICDYVQFSGDFMIDGADISIIEMLKAQFENGVRFWHDNDTRNPMTQNVLNNKMR